MGKQHLHNANVSWTCISIQGQETRTKVLMGWWTYKIYIYGDTQLYVYVYVYVSLYEKGSSKNGLR